MKVLDAHSWLQLKINKEKFPNASYLPDVMEAYAIYYHKETKKYDHLMEKWKSEWYIKYRLLDIDFEVFCKMMDYPKNDHDEYLRGDNSPGSL